MRMSAEIRGVERLAAKMGATKEAIALAAKRGIDRTALAMETDAKEKLKADGHIVTNRLRASIHAELEQGQTFQYSDNQGNAYDGSLQKDVGKLEAVVGTNVFYAPFIEFGTKYFSGDSFMGWARLRQAKLLKQRIIEEIRKLIPQP